MKYVLRKSVIFYILYHFYIEDLSNALITVNVFIFFCTFRLNCFFYYFNSFRIGIRLTGSQNF